LLKEFFNIPFAQLRTGVAGLKFCHVFSAKFAEKTQGSHPWVYPAQALIVGENARTDLNKEQAYIDEDNSIPFRSCLK